MDTTNQGTVFVSWLHPGEVSAAFCESLAGMIAYDFLRAAERGLPRQIAGVRGRHAGVNVAGPRNQTVADFLARPDWGEWLLMVDADMMWPPDAVERLLADADPGATPIVGGLCFGATDSMLWPTLYDLSEDEHGPTFVRYTTWPMDSLMRVGGTGAAFLMMHRAALERVRDAGFSTVWPWFQETELAGRAIGEDLTFCLRAGLLGLPIHVHTGVRIGHVKATLLHADRYLAQQQAVTTDG